MCMNVVGTIMAMVVIETSGSTVLTSGLVVRAWPHLSEEMDENDAEAWLVTPGVEEFDCEWYDFDSDSWSRDWEETNSLPKLVRVTLKMEKRGSFDEHLELQRLVDLEVAPEIPARENRDRTTEVAGGAAPASAETTGGATGAPADEQRVSAKFGKVVDGKTTAPTGAPGGE